MKPYEHTLSALATELGHSYVELEEHHVPMSNSEFNHQISAVSYAISYAYDLDQDHVFEELVQRTKECIDQCESAQ